MNINEAEKYVRHELGLEYSVLKLSGYWVIGRWDRSMKPIQSRSLPKAVAIVKAGL